jgi:hypothetical protein
MNEFESIKPVRTSQDLGNFFAKIIPGHEEGRKYDYEVIRKEDRVEISYSFIMNDDGSIRLDSVSYGK